MTRKKLAIIVLGLILFACLLACGYYGMKTLRRTQQRRAAMAAYERGELLLAKRLLLAYVMQDRNSEPEFVALAKIYHEIGDIGMEAQMWQMASSLNPLNDEYRENMLTSAMSSANYSLLHDILGRKARVGETFTGRELPLYVISSYRSGHPKDGDDIYKKAVKADPEAFQKNELGRMAEFMVRYSSLSEGEREAYLREAMNSEDPGIRFEALYTVIRRAATQQNDGTDHEGLLKQAVEINSFVGTKLLADYYFAQYRFEDVVAVLEPYLKNVDDLNLYLLYAESCVFLGRLDELRDLEKKLHRKTGYLPFLADYCELLIAYLEDDEEKIAAAVRKSGKLVNTQLSRFIRLRVAMTNNSFNEILTVAKELFSNPPFHDLSNRASLVCLAYLSEEMKKPENRKDPSRMAELANVVSGYWQGNRLLTEIILMDQYKRGLVKEEDLTAALAMFPDDLLLLEITVEYMIFSDKSETALSLLERAPVPEENGERLDFLRMLALDQQGQHDQAAEIFCRLVEHSSFDLGLLADFFNYCWRHERRADLQFMAGKLENATDETLKPYADFFHAALLLLEDDEAKKEEGLKLLAATPNDNPEFAFYAANRLSEADMLAEAEAKYKAILNTFSIPSLVYVNLSELYDSKGDTEKALDAAKKAYAMEKSSMLPAFVYAQRLSAAGRYEEAVSTLNFPRRAVNYRQDIVDLWADCMRKVIENSIRDHKYMPAEEQCKHLLVIVPGDEFGQAKLNEVNEILHPKKDREKEASEAAAS